MEGGFRAGRIKVGRSSELPPQSQNSAVTTCGSSTSQLLPYLQYFVLLPQGSQQNVPQNLEATGLCIHILWSGELERLRLKDLLEGREEEREWAAR